MIYWFITHTNIHFFDFFQYISIRAMGSFITSFVIGLVLFPKWIRYLNQLKTTFTVRQYVPKTHMKKTGTPSMGGILILFSILLSTSIWAAFNPYIIILLIATFAFGLLGFIDDVLKLKKQDLPGKIKLLGQIVLSIIFVYAIMQFIPAPYTTSITIPMFKSILIPLGFLYLPLVVLFITGTSNAVNLTDGLDGLASLPIIISSVTFGVLAYLSGNFIDARYLHLPFFESIGEVSIFASCIAGSMASFLWYNAPPARIFMGDTGSLTLGALLGLMAVIVHQILLSAIINALFLIEAVSVILQVASYKLYKKRIFAMAPLHHHFEQKGWAETTVVIRFWIIAFLFALLALATIKLR